MTAPQRLAQFVHPNVHEARLAHQWAKITNASRRRKRFEVRRFGPALAVSLFLCVALGVGWRWFRAASSSTLNGVVVESNATGAQILRLPDGSRIELSPDSRLVVDTYATTRIQLTLQQGRAEFEIAPQNGRRFSVLAGKFEVSVIGTHFSVAVGPASGPDGVTIKVERGKVSVRNRQSSPDERVLCAGQTWSASDVVQATPKSSELENDEEADSTSVEPPVGKLTRPASPSSTGVTDNAKSVSEAKDLFEAAQASRINGDFRQSADSLNRLRRTYRSDSRAGLAAFELGRMRMDIFGDVTGSIDALRDAIKLSPNAPFREDAEARLVQLYHRQGDPMCQVAKTRYLERYPAGAARKAVERLCSP